MSADDGQNRGQYRHIEWTLSAVPTMDLRHLGKCLTCGERSTDSAVADDAQLWCLKHAGRTQHRSYELSAFQYFNAMITDPAAGGTASK
ncbi:hypothetical protein [Streptomyces sp. NPDC051214]|uniref:DUF7848 domain-containing protein n=1 Tax=Streptomyces sp. NPDC051214 TaxID=3155282 RepID=UPI003442E3CF